jgi:hypothetical protein
MTRHRTPQRRSLDHGGDRDKLTLVDPATGQKYHFVRGSIGDAYQVLSGDEDLILRELYAAQASAVASAWSHPEDAAYDS